MYEGTRLVRWIAEVGGGGRTVAFFVALGRTGVGVGGVYLLYLRCTTICLGA